MMVLHPLAGASDRGQVVVAPRHARRLADLHRRRAVAERGRPVTAEARGAVVERGRHARPRTGQLGQHVAPRVL